MPPPRELFYTIPTSPLAIIAIAFVCLLILLLATLAQNFFTKRRNRVPIPQIQYTHAPTAPSETRSTHGRVEMGEQSALLSPVSTMSGYRTWPMRSKGKGAEEGKKPSIAVYWHGQNQLNNGFGWMA